jgi:hypothetical protein
LVSHRPGTLGVGLLVEKYVVPATVSGEFTTFSPTARSRYQPLQVRHEGSMPVSPESDVRSPMTTGVIEAAWVTALLKSAMP